MCTTPKVPATQTVTEAVATPTLADADVTKAKTAQRNKTAALASRDIKTSSRGLADDAAIKKKKLLGE